jgi:multidrug efflux pump subunit AcrA (membrane-fusion protein)
LSSFDPSRRQLRSRVAFAAIAALSLVCGAGFGEPAQAQAPAESPPPVGESPPPAERAHSDVRAQTRLVRRSSTAVTETQASELTLTLTEAEMRLIQTWVRTAGTLDQTGHLLTAFLRPADVEHVAVGQRVRAFPVAQRTQMYQAKISRITPEPGGARVEATIAARDFGSPYLMEIVVEQGPFLSVPNTSIIEEETGQVVYVQEAAGHYSPRTIHTGIQGELYTQVLDGVEEGDQIVSIGSFFVDADNKLKGGAE